MGKVHLLVDGVTSNVNTDWVVVHHKKDETGLLQVHIDDANGGSDTARVKLQGSMDGGDTIYNIQTVEETDVKTSTTPPQINNTRTYVVSIFPYMRFSVTNVSGATVTAAFME